MKSYRDYLDEKGVPRGPWVTRDREMNKPVDKRVVSLYNRRVKKESQNG